jgi:H+/Cl- antiporter ClcA
MNPAAVNTETATLWKRPEAEPAPAPAPAPAAPAAPAVPPIGLRFLQGLPQWLLLLLLYLVIGVLSSLSCGFVNIGSYKLIDARTRLVALVDGERAKMALFCAWGVVFTGLSVLVTRAAGSWAAGSGIPEVQASLQGIVLPSFFNARVLGAKILASTLVLASGLSVGKEGTFIAISVIITHTLSTIPAVEELFGARAITVRMTLLFAACCSGVTSTLGVPLGALMFALEVGQTAFVSLATIAPGLFTATVACVVSSLLARIPRLSFLSALQSLFNEETVRASWAFRPAEVLSFVLLGVICALVGIATGVVLAFVGRHKHLLYGRRRPRAALHRSLPPMLAVAAAVCAVTFAMGQQQRATSRESTTALLARTLDVHRFSGISRSLTVELLLFFLVKMVSTISTLSLPIPTGIFSPGFAAGAALGRVFGELLRDAFPHAGIDPAGYALVGAAALATALTRTISTAMVVVELTGVGTGAQGHALPVVIGVVASYMLASSGTSIYETLLAQRGLPFHPTLDESRYEVPVSEVMGRPSHVLAKHTTYGEVYKVLSRSQHFSFPVVRELLPEGLPDDSRAEQGGGDDGAVGVFIGEVSRDYLVSRLQRALVKDLAKAEGQAGVDRAIEIAEELSRPHAMSLVVSAPVEEPHSNHGHHGHGHAHHPHQGHHNNPHESIALEVGGVSKDRLSEPLIAPGGPSPTGGIGGEVDSGFRLHRPSTRKESHISSAAHNDSDSDDESLSDLDDRTATARVQLRDSPSNFPTMARHLTLTTANIDRSPLCISPHSPMLQMDVMIRQLGVRHLWIVEEGRLRGVVTKKHLLASSQKKKN